MQERSAPPLVGGHSVRKGARPLALEKGGSALSAPAQLSKFVNQLSERAVPVAKSIGNLLLRSALEKHRAEGLVAAVIRVRGTREELLELGAIHNGRSLELSVTSGRRTEGQISRDRQRSESKPREITDERALMPRPRFI